MSGVPPSSRRSMSRRYTCSSGFTYSTVPPPGHARHGVVEQVATRDQHARRPRSADELVRREEDRVLVVELGRPRRRDAAPSPPRRRARRPRSPRRTAPRSDGACTEIARVSDRMPVTFDAAEKLPIFTGRSACSLQRAFERLQVDPTVVVLGDLDHVGDRLAPRQLVGMVLVWADEHDGPLGRRDPISELIPSVEIGREPQVQARDELVDRARRPRARRTARRAPSGRRRRRAGSDRAPPRGTAWSACPFPRTHCGCWRTAAAPRRGCSPRSAPGSGPMPCSPRR